MNYFYRNWFANKPLDYEPKVYGRNLESIYLCTKNGTCSAVVLEGLGREFFYDGSPTTRVNTILNLGLSTHFSKDKWEF